MSWVGPFVQGRLTLLLGPPGAGVLPKQVLLCPLHVRNVS